MSEILAGWSEADVAGHMAQVYEPPQASEHGYTVIYLHGVHLQSLRTNEIYTREFARHGLRVIAPQTKRSWWADRICEEFDPQISAAAVPAGRRPAISCRALGSRPAEDRAPGDEHGRAGGAAARLQIPAAISGVRIARSGH